MRHIPKSWPAARRAGLTTQVIATAAILTCWGTVAASADASSAQAGTEAQPSSAVVMMYHRFGESALPSTNIRMPQFEAHLEELTEGKYTVRSLPDILAALKTGGRLANRTVGLSIDDAFLSVYREAWPRLKRAGLPFTLFVATDAVDRGGRSYMNWDQIRELARAGVTIAAHSASHAHLAALNPQAVAREFASSNARFEKELGYRPRILAYPYGEASLAVIKAAKAAGYEFAFGQHSGVLHAQSDFFYLPRFALNERYGSPKRFRQAANALPLFATNITPRDPMLGPNPPTFGFTVGPTIGGLKSLACYSSAHGKLTVTRLGERRIEARPPNAFSPGRARINCTLPAANGRWRWFGFQFYVPGK